MCMDVRVWAADWISLCRHVEQSAEFLPHVQFSLPMTNSSISSQHIPDALLVMDIIWSHIFCLLESGKYRIACVFMSATIKEWKNKWKSNM